MKLKRLIAGVVSAAMMLSIGSTLAFAADGDYETGIFGEVVTVNSIMYLSADAVSAPSVTYTYTLSEGEKEVYADVDAGADKTTYYDIYAGVLVDGVSITGTSGTAVEAANTSLIAADTIAADVVFSNTDYADTTTYSVTKGLEIDFSAMVATGTAVAPGMYHFVLTEKTESTLATLQNETTLTRDIYVTITADATGAVSISKVTMQVAAEYTNGSAEKSDSFVHSYGVYDDGDTNDDDEDDDDTDPGNNGGGTGAIFYVTDDAFGTYADHAKDFTFTLTASTESDAIGEGSVFKVVEADETVTYIYIDADGKVYYAEDDENDGYEAGDAYTFDLSSADKFQILGVADGMTFTVAIADDNDGYDFYARDKEVGYVAAEATEDNNEWTDITTTLTHTVAYDEDTVDGINFATVKGADVSEGTGDDNGIDYSATGSYPDTGVILEFAPFIIMVLAAGAFIAFRVYTTIKKK